MGWGTFQHEVLKTSMLNRCFRLFEAGAFNHLCDSRFSIFNFKFKRHVCTD
jgi:hypothetical protein